MTLFFNTLKYSQYYEDAGFTKKQSECLVNANEEQAEILANCVKDDLVKKSDLDSLRAELAMTKVEIISDIAFLKKDMNVLKKDLLIIFVPVIYSAAGIVIGYLHFFGK